jgi:hypothetical protein
MTTTVDTLFVTDDVTSEVPRRAAEVIVRPDGYVEVVPGTDDHWNLDPWTVRMPAWAAEALIEKGRTEAATTDAGMREALRQHTPTLYPDETHGSQLHCTCGYIDRMAGWWADLRALDAEQETPKP